MSESLLAVLILGAIVTGFGLLIIAISFIIGPRVPSPVKDDTYESGMAPIGPGRRRVPVRFYLVATLFILFDIEAVYLFPWAVGYRSLIEPPPDGIGSAALTSMGVFLGVLTLGLVYVWRKGALRWE
jgi:NADH-quinone oxidoreductase subunit A